MDLTDALYAALETAVTAAWSDVLEAEVFQSEHIDLFPFGDVTPPYAVINIEGLTSTEDWAIGPFTYLQACEIYYVAAVSGPVSGIRGKLETLRDYLYTNELSAGQVISATDLDWGRQMDLNVMLAERNMSQRAGKLTVNVLIGGRP